MVEGKDQVELVKEAANVLGAEPEELLNAIKKLKKEIKETKEEIKKLE